MLPDFLKCCSCVVVPIECLVFLVFIEGSCGKDEVYKAA